MRRANRLSTPLRSAVVALLLVVASGCSDDGENGADVRNEGGGQVEYLLCTEPEGSWTDLTGEDEQWAATGRLVGWTDETGCAVRLDHVWSTFGDDHCDWEHVEYLSIGLPIGTPYTGDDADPPGQDWEPLFIFNKDGAIDGLPPGERISIEELPATATDTGLRTVTNRRLFLAEDETAIYDVQGDSARVFARIPDDYGCA